MYEKEVLVSVIVPIYNAEKYLDRCVRSIINQTYKELEIILVNDGSNDGSLEICEKFQSEDNRIIIVSTMNKGVVNARKMGVACANGKFVGWVDADDWIEPEYFEKMVDAQKRSDADIVCAEHYHEIGNESSIVKNNFDYGVYTIDEIVDRILWSGKFYEFGIQPHFWNKLTKTEIIKGNQLKVENTISAGDDVAVVYPALLECKKICVSNICSYHYVQYANSISKNANKDEYEKAKNLFSYLEKRFSEKQYIYDISSQLQQYKKYFLLTRCIEVFDRDHEILSPYGGIDKNKSVVIYGAGVLGKRIYNYLSGQLAMKICAWVDQNYKKYQSDGFKVESPLLLQNITDVQYDYVLIAVTVGDTANAIKNYLITKLNIPEKKIRWITKKFTECVETLKYEK